MRVPVKLLGFGFWLFFLNCARCQECRREDIKYENTEPAAKDSYGDGETVRVSCMTGYTGLYKLKCEKGKWKQSIERPCARKKCSHPGDTPNGDFELKDGTEFVFGTMVVYTCKKGYEMASRINQRTCRDKGWDNAVPVCEAVRCPVIRTDGNVTASGNTEEGNYGDVIHFECVSPDKKIDGSIDIHCKETGEWSDAVPKCKEITCTAPVISNGYIVEPLPEYQKDAILKYRCYERFKPREGIPRCAKFGWTLNPECDEVTCEVKSTTFGVQNIIPKGKTIFKAGESVTLTCSYKYWIFPAKETIKLCTCQDNGEWDHKPVCEEIRCEIPYNQHVYYPYYDFRGDMKLEAKKLYSCESGYRKTAAEATCTHDGWTPKPLCAEIMCAAPNIENAEIVGSQRPNYRINSRIKYKCLPGFEPEQPVQITCNSQGQWTDIHQCTAMCAAPYIPNAETVGGQRPNYRINSTIEYKCSPGFEPEQPVQITCNSQAQWTGIQQCTEEVTCQFESIITSGVKRIIPEGQTVFKVGENVEIICTEKHLFSTKETSKSFTCQSNGKWDRKPGCEITCEVPHDQQVSGLEYYFRGDMKLGAKRSYSCKSEYRKTAEEATCTRDGWIPKPLCAEIMCDPPRIPNAEIVGGQRINYKIGSRIEYKCSPGFEPEQPVQITCDSQGQWTGIQQCTDGTCQEQELKNIEIIFGYPSLTSPYKSGHILVFRCTDDNMRFYGQHSVKCQPDGRWNYPYPQCGGTVQCSKQTKNLQFVTLSDEKTEYSNSESLIYTCKKPYNETAGGVLMCQNGNWNGTYNCRNKICPPPPYLQHGDYSIISTKDDVITAVSYTCQSYYVLTKQQDIYKCVDGKWETPPKCLRPCEIDDIVKKYNLQLPTEKVYIRHAEKYRLNCRDGWNTGSEMKAYVDVSCSDGNLQIDKSCDAQNNSK